MLALGRSLEACLRGSYGDWSISESVASGNEDVKRRVMLLCRRLSWWE
jgi:hypothetical protein